MNRPAQYVLIAAGVLGMLILLWPQRERDTVADGLLPEGQTPRLLNTAAPTLEASAAARMIVFAPLGAGPAPADAAAGPAMASAAPAPPLVDRTPILVGLSGAAAAPVGYFSYRGQTYRARRGETIGGWKVVALSRAQARLVKGRHSLTTALFAGRSGPLSQPAPSASLVPPQTVDTGSAAGAAQPTAADPAQPTVTTPPPGVRKRKPLPPLPAGSKGWWSGPKGDPAPPGYTRIPD